MSITRPFDETGLINGEFVLMGELMKRGPYYYRPFENREEMIEIYNANFDNNYLVLIEMTSLERGESGEVIVDGLRFDYTLLNKNLSVEKRGSSYKENRTLEETVNDIIEFFKADTLEIKVNSLKEKFLNIYGEEFFSTYSKEEWENLINFIEVESFDKNDGEMEEAIDYFFNTPIDKASKDWRMYVLSLENIGDKHFIKVILLEYGSKNEDDCKKYYFDLINSININDIEIFLDSLKKFQTKEEIQKELKIKNK